MYAGDWAIRFSQLVRQSAPGRAWLVPANVWGLGITSLLTDVSSEMVVSVLPAYLIFMSGGGPVALGIAAGMYEGGPVVATWLGGWMADRSGRLKLTAGCGYGLSAVCRLGWLLVTGRALGPIAALVVADRLGKAIRTAPRDALISLSVAPHQLATAFGVHRALDAFGAALGPMAAWLLLSMHPRRYDIVFFASIVAAVLGLVALVLLVRDTRRPPPDRLPWRQMGESVADVFAEAPLRRVLVIATLLGGVTIRDAFVYLLLVQGTEASAHWIPLFYSGTAVVFLALAIPLGVMADRFGRTRVFLAGHVVLLAVYAIALGATNAWPWNAIACVALLGAYYACTDGVLAGLAAGMLAAPRRSLGLAWIVTGVSLGRLCGAVAFGLLWARQGASAAVGTFAALLMLLLASAWLWLRREEGSAVTP
jgi:MFS family permease